MADFATRRIQALDACEKVINGIEDGTISISSALLQCMKVARLVNDTDAMNWLNYELGGYPLDNQGYVLKDAWNIAVRHGRSFRDVEDKKIHIFTELAAELENLR